MYGCYKISVFDKNKNEKKSIYRKNNITKDGKKKILDMFSFRPNGTFGYKKAEKIYEGSFQLNGKTCKYKSSFFGWGIVNHPFTSSTLSETSIAKNVLTEGGSLSERDVDRILKTNNTLKIDWGKNISYTSDSSSNDGGYGLNSQRVWFNIAFGTVEQTEKFVLPIIDDPEIEKMGYFTKYELGENGNVTKPEGVTIVNADGEIKLLGHKIYKGSVSVKGIVTTSPKNYTEGNDYQIDYENGKLIINSEMRENLYVEDNSNTNNSNPESTENKIIRNEIEITYTWCGAEYIDELKKGICGVYVNAQPSVQSNSSSSGNNNYFGMGTFSCDCGKSWGGYSFPWKGQPLENINFSNYSSEGKNMTAFYSLNTEFEHYFPTFPYVFVNPTNFAFAFCSSGTNSFHIRNLNFLIPDFPQPSLQEIELVGDDEKSIKKPIEWSGVGEDENGIYAEWKTYIETTEANNMEINKVKTYFSNQMKNQESGWQTIEYPEIGTELFSEATFDDSQIKNNDESIEVSYRIYFEGGGK